MNPNPQKPWPGDLRQPPGPGGVNYPVVLIVDDHDDTREMLKTLLGMVGCHAIEAEDGERALDAAENVHPDLILLDMKMPRLDGLTVTRLIRSHPNLHAFRNIIAGSAPGTEVTLTVKRDGREQQVRATLGEFAPQPEQPRD
jgi:CheY-like chemotaxis protein